MKVMFLVVTAALAVSAVADNFVPGYTRKDGTYVPGYHRTDSNSTVRDNYSYKGNYNPYTGATGTNTYPQSPSSGYYQGGYQGGYKNPYAPRR